MKIAYMFSGSPRSFTCAKVHWSIKMYLLDALHHESYVFVRVSTVDNDNVHTAEGVYIPTVLKENELNETLKILNPRVVEYISLKDETSDMQSNYPGERHTVFRIHDRRRYSMYYHRCMTYKMVTAYEKEHRIKFDWVIMARLDTMWLEPLLPISFYRNDRVWLTEQVPLRIQ